jgi:hypothetical protein
MSLADMGSGPMGAAVGLVLLLVAGGISWLVRVLSKKR